MTQVMADDNAAGGDFGRWLTGCCIDVAQDSVRRDTPLWNAIFDMCAVAWRSALRNDPVSDLWIRNNPGAAYDNLSDDLWRFTGLTLPRRLFDAAWRLYDEGYSGNSMDFNHEWHLRNLALGAVSHMTANSHDLTFAEAASSFTRKRYGDESDDPADDLLPGFAHWLDAEAPLLLAQHEVPEGSPIWNAVFDLRAAMIHDRAGDSSSDDWVTEAGIRHRAPVTLASFGIPLPPDLFEQVWKFYQRAPRVRRYDASWAEYRLRTTPTARRSHGPQGASNRRYGTVPTPP
jgi:hypothetical protein